jgi:hypothetical protein
VEKVMIVVPGLNSLPGILNLTATSLERILASCPNIKKIGNLLSWKLRRSEGFLDLGLLLLGYLAGAASARRQGPLKLIIELSVHAPACGLKGTGTRH